jgi:hypothetical protein
MGPVLVEEFVGDPLPHARLPLELKLHMFNERVGAIAVVERNPAMGQPLSGRFYSASWEAFSDPMYGKYSPADPIPTPSWLPELLKAGQRLGRAYGTYVRVDFLVSEDGLVFGELATTPGGRWTAFADEYFGRMWQEAFPDAL